MSGRHSKPPLLPLKIKLAGGVVAGAALAGTVAASAMASATNPDGLGQSGSSVAGYTTAGHESPHSARAASRHGHARDRGGAEAADAKAEDAKDEDTKDKSAHKGGSHRKITAQDVLKLARTQLGTSENRAGETMFNKWYMSDSRALQTLRRDGGTLKGYQDASWCDMFVSWIGSKLGISGSMGFDAFTVKHAEWFKDRGRWGGTPKPGAVVFFSWSGGGIDDIDHVGLTIKDNRDGTIQTIEGNTHNTVAIRTRDKDKVVGYGYPDYVK